MSKHNTPILERQFVPKGTLLMEEGEAANSAYIIQSGRVEVYMEHDGKVTSLAVLEPGDIVGEMALIFDEPRQASVRALEDCNLILITRHALKEKLANSDATIRAIVAMLSKRVTTGNDVVADKSSDIDGMIARAHAVYRNVLNGLPKSKQQSFEDTVYPKLEAFSDAVKSFDS